MAPAPEIGANPAGPLARYPGRLVLGFALAQLVAWTVVPALVQPNLPLDVIEGLAWGHEWQLGYAKHPPLQAWLLEATAWLLGARDWPVYLLAQLAVVASFAAVWALSRELVGRTGAALSVLALAGIYYFSLPTPEFNPNVVQMPIWAALCLVFYQCLTRPGWRWWLLLGGLAALGLYAKYFTGVLLAVLALFMLIEPRARALLARPGPYLALAVMGLLVTPHLWWLVSQDFTPFGYATARGAADAGLVDHVLYPLKFAATQLADHGGLIALVLLGRWGLWRAGDLSTLARPTGEDGFRRRFIATIALGPLALSMLISGLWGLKFQSMWGAPMFCFSGLAVVAFLRPVLAPARLRQLAVLWCALFLGGLVFFAAAKTLGPALRGEASKHHYPGQASAAYFTDLWRQRFGQPLAIVVGDAWIGGNIAFYAADRPRLFIEGDRKRGFWITPDALAQTGALVVWRADRHGATPPPALVGQLALERLGPGTITQFAWQTGPEIAPIRLGWAVLAPAAR